MFFGHSQTSARISKIVLFLGDTTAITLIESSKEGKTKKVGSDHVLEGSFAILTTKAKGKYDQKARTL